MKLIIIYGPPGVGKLTVAKELAKLTKYKIFHNHLTVDLLSTIFEVGSEGFFSLNSKIRLDVIEVAAKKNIDLISTYCYAYSYCDKFVKDVINKVKEYGGEVCFVQLLCDKSVLKKRIKEPSRKIYNKISTIKTLESCFKKWDLITPVPFVKHLCVDNTNVAPKKVALMIKEYYKI